MGESWTYVIGDIHGCLGELGALEDKVARHAARHGARPFLVSAGDLVDRGPDSAGVVRRFREGVAAGTHAAVMGNHEQELLRALEASAPWNFAAVHPPRHLGPGLFAVHASGHGYGRWLSWPEHRDYQRLNWLGQGGATALASWGRDPHDAADWRLPGEDLAFLAALPVVWEDDSVVVTHALASRAELATLRAGAADPAAWVTDGWAGAVHAALWNRRRPGEAPDPDRWHVSGHTPGPRVRKSERLRLVQVDTGCVYGRRLTAWCARTGDILAVPFGRAS